MSRSRLGATILPELIRRDRDEYCQHLQHAHDAFNQTGQPDLQPLHAQVERLLIEQLQSANVNVAQPTPANSTASPST